MARPAAVLKRTLIFVHRWLGVGLSILFLLWFASGIVMMYWSFPDVSADDRLQRLPSLDAARVTISPEQAIGAAGLDEPPAQIRLSSFDGRPVYRLGAGGRGGDAVIVFADDGSVHDVVTEAMIDRAAAAWAGRPVTDARKALVDEVDQWTVAGGLSNTPLSKYSFADGQQVYVNRDTAEVVQYTTTASRLWAYLGAIPHWMYFTPLRKHGPQWFSFVVWSSLIGTIAALLGVVIAIWMYSPRQRYRHAGMATSIPYRGWKRWHTIIGLFFGVMTVTWAFSGLLSMGPFPITDKLAELTVPAAPAGEGPSARRGGRGGGRASIAAALRGRGGARPAAFAEKSPGDAIASLGNFGVKELEYSSFAGQPVYVATNGAGDTRIVPVRGTPRERFDTNDIIRIVREAGGKDVADIRVIDEYDAYYLDRRREAPLPVVFVQMDDAVKTRYYIDPKTARIVGSYNARNWVSRWLYHGLHSLDFPWLYKYRPLWDIVVITLMLGGTALCVTSLMLAYRVLAKKVATLVRARFTPPNEDLAVGT